MGLDLRGWNELGAWGGEDIVKKREDGNGNLDRIWSLEVKILGGIFERHCISIRSLDWI